MSEGSQAIEWNPDFLLSVEHFKGMEDPNDPHDAKSHTGVNYFFKHHVEQVKNRYKVRIEEIWTKSYFFPLESWLRKKISGEINLPKLLKHEQGHFDIAEKFARKFQRKLKNKFRGKTFVFKINEIKDPVAETKKTIQLFFGELNEQVQREHVIYDKETNHGLINSVQEKYDARFAQLRKTNAP